MRWKIASSLEELDAAPWREGGIELIDLPAKSACLIEAGEVDGLIRSVEAQVVAWEEATREACSQCREPMSSPAAWLTADGEKRDFCSVDCLWKWVDARHGADW
jgi:hypothetical protein